MADRRLAIEVTVEGDATRVFREIGQAARDSAQVIEASSQRTKAGIERIEKAADAAEDTVEELATAQTKAAKAADEMARQADKSSRSLSNYKDAVSKTQQGLALLGGAFTVYANQAREHEVTVMAIQRVYGEAAQSYIDFANQIQNTSIFSNDEALEAARIMGTLRENYELTDQQVQQLIQTSADLATMHGMTLADAALRVQSAIRGEAESAEMLGLTMNQAAIDTQGLTLTMGNAEAAQFRFDAMMRQSTSSVGFAAQAAEDAAGKTQQLANRTQDAVMQFVAFTGPVGQAAAGLGAFGLQGGLAATGLIQLGRGLGSAAAAAGGMTALLGPAGLIVLGLGAAAVAGTLLARSMRDDVAEAMKTARLEGEELDATISALTGNLSGLDLDFAGAIVGSDDALDELQGIVEYWDYLVDKWASFPTDRLNLPAQAMAELDAATRESIETQRRELGYIQQYTDEYGSLEQAAISLAEAERDLNSILTHRGAGREEILSQLSALIEARKAETITIVEYTTALNELEAQMTTIDNDVILNQLAEEEEAARQAAEAMRLLRQEQALWNGADFQATTIPADLGVGAWLLRFASMRADFSDGVVEGLDAIAKSARTFKQEDYAAAVNDYADALVDFDKTASLMAQTIDQETRATLALDDAFSQVTGSIKGEIGRSIEELNADFEQAVRSASGLSDALYELRARNGTMTLNLAVNTGGAQGALQSGYNAIVGGTRGMGQLAGQTADWAASLTDANTGMSKLDNLLLKGQISSKTYRDALAANHQIQVANADIQEDVLRIQAKQLPVMAQLTEQYAQYIDGLADASAEEQTVALGYMDTAKAAQAMGLAQLAATAAMSGNTEAAGAMIVAMAEADPILKAMLIDMGLLSEKDGKLTVDFGDVGDADAALKTLNGTLVTLTDVIAQAFNIDVNLDDDNAYARLLAIWNMLNALDGKSVTAFATTIGLNAGALAATGTTVQHPGAELIMPPGSEIRRLATGGQITLVGEAGPELVSLPTGSTVTNAAGTRGRLDPMGRGTQSGQIVSYRGAIVNQTIVRQDSALERRAARLASGRRR